MLHEAQAVLHSPRFDNFILNYAGDSERVKLHLFPGWRLAGECPFVCAGGVQANYNLITLAKQIQDGNLSVRERGKELSEVVGSSFRITPTDESQISVQVLLAIELPAQRFSP